MSNSPEELQTEFEKLRQHFSNSIDIGMITGDDYDQALDIISKAYPAETREVNIDEGVLDEDSDPSKIGGAPMMELLFDAVEDKATFISDFKKAFKFITQSRTHLQTDEVAQEIINSR